MGPPEARSAPGGAVSRATEFQNGQAAAARRQLLEIAARVAGSGGLYEWHALSGEGHGSPRYAGSAGALSAALYPIQ